jgi:DNA-binding SARP family transcriptional activator
VVVLHALGQCLIRTAVTTITPRAEMCFSLASYLTRERGKRVPRRFLETLLWPRMHAADASHSLSELIHKLRRKGVPIQRDDAACIWLPREAVALDIESLSAEPLADMARKDLAILPGYEPSASPAFNDLIDEWRGQMQRHVLTEVVTALARAAATQDWHTTLALAEQALRLDAENEPALLARARAAEQLARHDSARAHVERSASHLREGRAVTGWPVRQQITSGSDDTALVGREQPMERLRTLARRALRGDVVSTYISAPAGVGKSRLVRELSAWMRGHGGVVCNVPCARHDSRRPLSAFIQAVPRLQALPGAAGCAPSTIDCLTRITQLPNEEPDMGMHDDSIHLSESIRASVIDLVDAVADEQPLLLVVEDVHWIDPMSWSLLRTIAATAQHSVLLICTSRVRWLHQTWGEPDTFVIEALPTLDASAALAHIDNYLAKLHRGADDRFMEWCVETSGGNPYFIEELVNFWATTGQQYSAPPSLIALVEARLACLRPDALRVIQAAAVLGRNSTLELLQQVLEFPTHVLFASIEELGEAGMLATDHAPDRVGTAPVLCRHDIVMRAATRALSAQGRALLHHAAARAIEPIASASQSAELRWDCADHWQAAGQADRSIAALVACARHLHDMGLVHDAVSSCQSALAMPQSDSSRATVLRAMAQAQYAAREWQNFCETVKQVRSLENISHASAPIHDDLELFERSAQHKLHRDWKSALTLTLRCVHSIAADPAHRVRAAISALKLATNLGDLEVMDAVYDEMTHLWSAPGVEPQDRLMLTMVYHTIRGNGSVCAEAARELLLVAERSTPLVHRLPIMLNCATALRRGGLPGESESVCETLFRLAVPLHCFDIAAEACDFLIEMHIDSGRVDCAGEWERNYRRLRRPKSELRAHRSLRVAIARVHAWRGEWGSAGKLLATPRTVALWDDAVTMLRSGALATKLRIEIGRAAPRDDIAGWILKLAPLNQNLRTVGAQDYECYSLYMGYRYIGNDREAEQLLRSYANLERRDKRPIAAEIADELTRIGLSL